MAELMPGRIKPYTAIGITRVPCARCGNPAHAAWQICADNNLHRPLCQKCDIALNEMVLRWVGFRDWKEKMRAYLRRLHG